MQHPTYDGVPLTPERINGLVDFLVEYHVACVLMWDAPDKFDPDWQSRRDTSEKLLRELGIDPAKCVEAYKRENDWYDGMRVRLTESLTVADLGLETVEDETGETVIIPYGAKGAIEYVLTNDDEPNDALVRWDQWHGGSNEWHVPMSALKEIP